ncbi:MAG: BrnT family toxin [Gammaproteobacteria bacterium]|nr:BrnT family toxin [Gammaproteobacteria bacterium]
MKFEWDKNKAQSNEKKHQVSFSEASSVFADPFELTVVDPDHSSDEYRFISIGKSRMGRLLIVSYTERELDSIRIISARSATQREQKYYAQKH